MMKLIMTSRNHEVILLADTTFQTCTWSGYCHAPRNVEIFSASQMNNAMRQNASASGMLRTLSVATNVMLVRAKRRKTAGMRMMRRSGMK